MIWSQNYFRQKKPGPRRYSGSKDGFQKLNDNNYSVITKRKKILNLTSMHFMTELYFVLNNQCSEAVAEILNKQCDFWYQNKWRISKVKLDLFWITKVLIIYYWEYWLSMKRETCWALVLDFCSLNVSDVRKYLNVFSLPLYPILIKTTSSSRKFVLQGPIFSELSMLFFRS